MSKTKHPEKHLDNKITRIVFDAIATYDKSKSGDVYLFNVADMSDIVKKITADIVEELS